MGALSPAQANQAILWFLVFLVALLVLSLAAVIASPLRTESAAVSEADGEPDPPWARAARIPAAAPRGRPVRGWPGRWPGSSSGRGPAGRTALGTGA